MEYWGRCYRRAFAGSVLLTDKISILAGVLAPALFFVLGKSMDATYQAYISWGIIIVVGGGVFLRFLTSPYFIWKEDQRQIAELKSALADSSRQRRQFFENDFLSERSQLAKDLTYFVVLTATMENMATFDPDSLLQPLTRRAILFKGDGNFDTYWDTFCIGMRQSIRGSKFAADSAQLSQDHQTKLGDRFRYDFEAMRAGATALVYILTENMTHRAYYDDIISRLGRDFSHVTFETARELESTLWTANPYQPPPDTEEGKPQ